MDKYNFGLTRAPCMPSPTQYQLVATLCLPSTYTRQVIHTQCQSVYFLSMSVHNAHTGQPLLNYTCNKLLHCQGFKQLHKIYVWHSGPHKTSDLSCDTWHDAWLYILTSLNFMRYKFTVKILPILGWSHKIHLQFISINHYFLSSFLYTYIHTYTIFHRS